MQAEPTRIPDVLLLTPRLFEDERGWFMETWQRRTFAALGIDHDFVQDNHSCSARGTLRGLHYQISQPQGKLVRVTAGEIYDVAVDLRRSSPTFGRWVGAHLSADNRCQLWVPPGFAHGFYATADRTQVQYKCTDYYSPDHERTLLWCDEALAIEWPIPVAESVTVSDKDGRGSALHEAECYP